MGVGTRDRPFVEVTDEEKLMDELKTTKQQAPQTTTSTAQTKPAIGFRRFPAISVIVLIVIVAIGAAIARHVNAVPPTVAVKATEAPTDVIETTPDQLKQIRVEPVTEQIIDLDLETTGKVGFDEDRLTPVFVPYGGRVLEVLANKGEMVKSGQPLLVVDSPDLVAAINDLASVRADVDKG